MSILANRRVLLGITGGVAAYKAAELVRLLRQQSASVRVAMTEGAQAFITPLTLQALSGNPVHTHLLDPAAEAGMGHIELAKWAEMVVIAPASANFLARLATGQADDLLATVCLATSAPIAVAPAMNQAMWRNPATQHNYRVLQERGVRIWGPAEGSQACGDIGPGRMLEAKEIAVKTAEFFTPGILQGQTWVITTGPTREPLDPVRYISNHSSGKMGYALAAAARDAGARVILVSGPTYIPTPERVELRPVQTAQEMLDVCLEVAGQADVFIAAAAVADYRPVTVSMQKIKKGQQGEFQLQLQQNPDIVATIASMSKPPFMVGFAAETEKLLEHARSKLQRKNLDLVIANDVTAPGLGFNSDRNAVWLVDRDGVTDYPENSKQQLARDLVREIGLRYERRSGISTRGNSE
jgi:phosphopantothenoylcysteine decarboxylase/phosphopantothenate--cysteine ligase